MNTYLSKYFAASHTDSKCTLTSTNRLLPHISDMRWTNGSTFGSIDLHPRWTPAARYLPYLSGCIINFRNVISYFNHSSEMHNAANFEMKQNGRVFVKILAFYILSLISAKLRHQIIISLQQMLVKIRWILVAFGQYEWNTSFWFVAQFV